LMHLELSRPAREWLPFRFGFGSPATQICAGGQTRRD
jgi:hypothetical protein